MYRKGHYGLGLIFAAPIAVILGILIGEQWTILTLLFSIAGARIPDFDQRVPFIAHRGFSHTIWFALIVSLGLAAGATLSLTFGISDITTDTPVHSIILSNPVTFSASFIGFFAGFVSHLFGDILTEAYDYTVNPYWPVSNRAHTLNWTNADSVWNYIFLVAGICLAIGATALVNIGF